MGSPSLREGESTSVPTQTVCCSCTKFAAWPSPAPFGVTMHRAAGPAKRPKGRGIGATNGLGMAWI
jgi:hypothetical protein